MDLIKKYIKSLTNLYGQVSVKKVIAIYNEQNDDQITVDNLQNYFDADMSRDYVYYYKKHFVHETIMMFNEFRKRRRRKKDKPYYVPEKRELLKYSDIHYYEKSKVYHELYNYFLKHFYPDDEENAEMLCQNIVSECREGLEFENIIAHFNLIEITFKNKEELNKILALTVELSNNLRIWENNGFTPNEMDKLLRDKPGIFKRLFQKLFGKR
ncbi:MAG: hypothetical protein U9N10_09450 [Bacillota bacterium]|nr:hypothetical protein [Bacillota bacterium]